MNANPTAREDVIPVGAPAPDFTLFDQQRNDWSLGDALRRGDVVLSFYPFAFTGVCRTEMECITREMDRWTRNGGTVVGVSCDSPAANGAWAEQVGLRHTLLSDLHRTVVKAYGLYWPDLNVAWRGTVVVGASDDGAGIVKWSQRRDIPDAMDLEQVLDAMA